MRIPVYILEHRDLLYCSAFGDVAEEDDISRIRTGSYMHIYNSERRVDYFRDLYYGFQYRWEQAQIRRRSQ